MTFLLGKLSEYRDLEVTQVAAQRVTADGVHMNGRKDENSQSLFSLLGQKASPTPKRDRVSGPLDLSLL
ncbi:MAG: hypothetical protein IT290_04975 [Deltaproteobacteria bacterium]|nr:hypothetical protein [Deltaproteobacteria bacterium]